MGCVRVSAQHQYRANGIEMKHPVTYTNTTIMQVIEKYIEKEYFSGLKPLAEFYIVEPTPIQKIAFITERKAKIAFTTSTWFGLTIDTMIEVYDCNEVYRAQSVTI